MLGLKLVTGQTGISEGEDVAKGLGMAGPALKLAIFEVGNGSLELMEYVSLKSSVRKASPRPP